MEDYNKTDLSATFLKSSNFKSDKYFSRKRPDILRYVQGERNIILDVGCGFGIMGALLLKKGTAKAVFGVEISHWAASRAKTNIDRIICCDIEKSPLKCKDFFDYIILGDVLEHLRDPGAVLTKLRGMLKPTGKIVACLPNIRYWKILRDLAIFDKFDYVPAGILDSGHLRFYTFSSAKKLFSDCRYKILSSRVEISGRKQRILNVVTFGLFKTFLATAIYIVACKNGI